MIKKIILVIIIIAIIVLGGIYLNKSGDKQEQNIGNDQQIEQIQNQTTTVPSLAPTTKSYTISEVALHNKAGNCWTAIDGKVYDLTTWPEKHPGGDKAIFAICGIDGTAPFHKQHGGQEKPENTLDGFYIGELAK